MRSYVCSGLVLAIGVSTLRPRQNDRHFADDTFKRIFLNEDTRISIKMSLNFVPKGPTNNILALVQITAWRRPGDKPLSESMMARLLTHIYAWLGLIEFGIMDAVVTLALLGTPWHMSSLQRRHNGPDRVSNHQPHHCLLNRLFRRRSKKTLKLCVTGLYAVNSPVTSEFPAQMASNAEIVSIWWRHHVVLNVTGIIHEWWKSHCLR